MIDDVQTTRLPNGIAVLTEHMPGLRSVTAGIWVRRGSRHESAELNGICHFIEHAVFKGTRHRTARDIAVETDRLGGHLDAYTTHEMTGFTTKVADTALSQAVDLLADLVANPRFEQEDLEREQKVILEEMKMVEDTPDELLGELFNAAYFPNQPLGRTIDNGRPRPAAPILIEQKSELEQAHLVIATPWPSALSEDRYAASLLASVIGGGTSSRLWQEVREERGLAYSVGAVGSHYTDAGVFQIYAGTSPEHLDEVLDISLAEMRRVLREAVGEEELQLVKDQAVSSILLGLESTSARAGTLARQEIVHGRRIPPEQVIARIEAVTPEDLLRVASEFFRTDALAVGALGDLNGFKVDRARLEV